MDALIQDLKFAGRQLWKDKGFLLTAGLTLALCMGANATIFSVVNSVILQPLDVPEPERVVTMWNAYPGAMPQGMSGRVRGSNAVPDYYDRRALTDVFAELAVYDGRGYSIEIEGTPQRVRAQEVSPSYFRLLGANAAHGRVFTEEEGEPGANNVVVLSHGLWEQLYGSDASVIGDEMRIDAAPYTIVGVMPRNFAFLDPDVRLWTPAGHTLESRQQYHNNSWSMIARLQPGASLEQAQERVDALNAANMDKVPELKPLLIDAGYHVPLHLLQEDLTHDIRGVLYMLWGGCRVRAADRRGERGQPRTGPVHGALQGDRDALRAGRSAATGRAAAGHRDRRADADRRGRRTAARPARPGRAGNPRNRPATALRRDRPRCYGRGVHPGAGTGGRHRSGADPCGQPHAPRPELGVS